MRAGDAGGLPGRLLPRRCDRVVLAGLAARASLWNRRRKLALFMETLEPGPETRVVDVGVGDTGFGTEPAVESSHNFFEGSTRGPADHCRQRRAFAELRARLPDREHRDREWDRLPSDDAFDVAFSNAMVDTSAVPPSSTVSSPSCAGSRRVSSSPRRTPGFRSRPTRSCPSSTGSHGPLPTESSPRSGGTTGSRSGC